MIDRLDVRTPRDGAVFWSGDAVAAQRHAARIGGVTLESTPGGRVIDGWTRIGERFPWDPNKPATDFWGNVSEKYSLGARGRVHVVQTAKKAAEGGGLTWRNREQPTLKTLQRAGLVDDPIIFVPAEQVP